MSGWAIVALAAAAVVWIACFIMAATEIAAFLRDRRR